MKNILLIGVGKLGSRHLQALAKVTIDVSISVVDPGDEAVEIAKKRYAEIPENNKVKSMSFYKDISELNTNKFDLAIVATTSEFRFSVIEKLLERNEIRYMVLEKFLFQREEEFTLTAELLKKNNVTAWVNCPRRMWPLYISLKKTLSDAYILDVTIIGKDWSLATSSIHLIDLVAFLTGKGDYELLNLDFGNTYVPAYSSVTGARESKYIEFYGSMKGKFNDSAYFNFTCLKNNEAPFLIQILTEDRVINIYEELGKIQIIHTKGNNAATEFLEDNFSFPYQSELTNKVVEQLMFDGTCPLTPYEESSKLHLPLLKAFLNIISTINGKVVTACPIT